MPTWAGGTATKLVDSRGFLSCSHPYQVGSTPALQARRMPRASGTGPAGLVPSLRPAVQPPELLGPG